MKLHSRGRNNWTVWKDGRTFYLKIGVELELLCKRIKVIEVHEGRQRFW